MKSSVRHDFKVSDSGKLWEKVFVMTFKNIGHIEKEVIRFRAETSALKQRACPLVVCYCSCQQQNFHYDGEKIAPTVQGIRLGSNKAWR